MIIISGTFKFKADKLEEAKEALITVQQLSSAEDGCYVYRYSQDLEDPTLFHLYEEWDNQEALDAHGKTSHIAEMRAKRAPIIEGDPQIKVYHLDSSD